MKKELKKIRGLMPMVDNIIDGEMWRGSLSPKIDTVALNQT